MVVHEEGEIMQTEQDPTMELSMVSMDLTLLHCPLCLRPLKPPVYEVRIHLVRSADRYVSNVSIIFYCFFSD